MLSSACLPNTWSAGSVVRDDVSHARAAVLERLLDYHLLRGLTDTGNTWILWAMMLVNCSVAVQDHCTLSKELNFGVLSWRSRPILLFMLVVIK